MKKRMIYRLWCGAIGFSLWVCPTSATAHSVEYRLLSNAAAVVAEFYYSDGQPMSFAEVLIFNAADRKIEYQNGRTDQRGRFAFYPNAAGIWWVEVNDGLGHKAQAQVKVENPLPENVQEQSPPTPKPSITIGVIAGLSLILNLTLIACCRKTDK